MQRHLLQEKEHGGFRNHPIKTEISSEKVIAFSFVRGIKESESKIVMECNKKIYIIVNIFTKSIEIS